MAVTVISLGRTRSTVPIMTARYKSPRLCLPCRRSASQAWVEIDEHDHAHLGRDAGQPR